jgi:hypothetical protein
VAQLISLGIIRALMKYPDGSPVKLGDIVTIPLPSGSAKARVVMLGDTREHLDIEKSFLDWVEGDKKLLEPSYVVVEWIDQNPLAHNDPKYAPVGNYMFTELDECVTHDNHDA